MDPPELPGEPTSPSVSSRGTSIAVGSTPEEELYAAAGHPKPPRLSVVAGEAGASCSSASTASSTAATGLPGSFISSATLDTSEGSGSGSGISAGNPFAFDGDMSNYPPSMTSSIRAHVYEGGLRYHAFRDGRYAFPNDDVEQNRDDMKHTMTLMLCRGRYFYSPVEEKLQNGGACLDLGGLSPFFLTATKRTDDIFVSFPCIFMFLVSSCLSRPLCPSAVIFFSLRLFIRPDKSRFPLAVVGDRCASSTARVCCYSYYYPSPPRYHMQTST